MAMATYRMVYGDDEQVVRETFEDISEVEREDGWVVLFRGKEAILRVQEDHVQELERLDRYLTTDVRTTRSALPQGGGGGTWPAVCTISPKRGRPRPDNRARPVTLTAWPDPGLGGVTQGAQLDAGSIRPARPGRGPGPGPPPATAWRRRNHAPRALGRAAPLVVAAAPPARRAAARARRRPARTLLRPGRGRPGCPGRPPPGRAPDMARPGRVRRGVHAGVDRLGQRQSPPRAARPRRRPRPQHVPAADPGAGRDGRLHPRGGRCAGSGVRRRRGRAGRGASRALGPGPAPRPARITPGRPGVP